VRDDPTVVALVTGAAGGDPTAREMIVERYGPLVWSICTRFRLSNHDREDVGQNLWLLLVEQLGKLRERAALPGWIATTTHRECLRVVTAARKSRAWAPD
jgi:DNA-directed RNA polymerase specialized sigma24 family protein